MSKKDITEVAAPTERKGKTINIDGVEYNYSFAQLEKEEGILIQLSEVKPDKNITFSYQATSAQITKDIKALCLCENIEEMINSLKDIFNSGEIKVEKKEEKYFMKIEVKTFGKLSKYEIELEKHEPVPIEPINQSTYLLNQLKDIDKKYKELKEEINNLKINNNPNKQILNEDEKIKLIKEIKDNLDLSEKIKEVLQDSDIKDKLFQEFEEKISKIYIKKEKEEKKDKKDNNELIFKKVDESVNKIINEKLCNKVDERVFNENMNKIKEDIGKQVNEIN